MTHRPQLWWSRGDSRFLEAILLVGIVATVVFGVASPVLGDAGARWLSYGAQGGDMTVAADLRDPVPVPDAAARQAGAGVGSTSVEISGAQRVDVTFRAPTAGQRVSYLVGPLALALSALAVLVLLLLMARSLSRGEPFTTANARRVTAVGLLVAAAGTFGPLLTQLTQASLLESSVVAPLLDTTTSTLSFVWLVIGLVIIAVGEVFRRGVTLRRDVDGLV